MTTPATTVRVDLGPRGYDVVIEPGSLIRAADHLAAWRNGSPPGTALVVADANTFVAHATAVLTSVRDDGSGFDVAANPSDHFGLLGLREQAELIDAGLSIDSTPGQGTCVAISLPLASSGIAPQMS